MDDQESKLRRVIDLLDEVANGSDNTSADILANHFLFVHRTTQQSILRLLARFINKISDLDTDLRNEAAVKWAKKVSEIDANFPFI